MTVTLHETPTLVEFLIVLGKLPADEIEQYEALTGSKFEPERVAATYFLRDCPKWVVYADGQPIAIAGFDDVGNGVWQDWMFSTPEAWSKHWRGLTRMAKRVMDWMLKNDARRLQCVSLASRIQAHKWYGALGLELDGTLRGLGKNGEDALMFSRLRSTDG